jgi:hypothetical protein
MSRLSSFSSDQRWLGYYIALSALTYPSYTHPEKHGKQHSCEETKKTQEGSIDKPNACGITDVFSKESMSLLMEIVATVRKKEQFAREMLIKASSLVFANQSLRSMSLWIQVILFICLSLVLPFALL